MFKLFNVAFKAVMQNAKLSKNAKLALSIAQAAIDMRQEKISNESTHSDARHINDNQKKSEFGPVSATIEKDRHGKGNDGIKLDVKYDPSNGSARFGFGLKFK